MAENKNPISNQKERKNSILGLIMTYLLGFLTMAFAFYVLWGPLQINSNLKRQASNQQSSDIVAELNDGYFNKTNSILQSLTGLNDNLRNELISKQTLKFNQLKNDYENLKNEVDNISLEGNDTQQIQVDEIKKGYKNMLVYNIDMLDLSKNYIEQEKELRELKDEVRQLHADNRELSSKLSSFGGGY